MADSISSVYASQDSPKQTYSEIVDFLSSCHEDPEVTQELEILPSNFDLPAASKSLVLRDGPSLAIRKKDLAAAFVVARKLLFPSSGRAASPSTLSDEESAAAFKATGVILCFDTEHLTAANFRKRYLLEVARQEGHVPSDSGGARQFLGSERLYREVSHELRVISSLLTSPLKRHSKSPTLFYHLLWIWKTFYWLLNDWKSCLLPASSSGPSPESPKGSRPRLLLKQHNDVGLKAADRHFANYYAFQYLRRLVQLFEMEALNIQDRQNVVDIVHYWCLGNPRDVSGWAYLVFLLERPEGGLAGKQAQIISSVQEWKTKYSDWGRDDAVRWFERAMCVDKNVKQIR